MAIKATTVTLAVADGKKSLSEILGVTERWEHVVLTCAGSGALLVGDSTLTTSTPGLQMFGEVRDLAFSRHNNPGNELYLQAINANVILRVLAY